MRLLSAKRDAADAGPFKAREAYISLGIKKLRKKRGIYVPKTIVVSLMALFFLASVSAFGVKPSQRNDHCPDRRNVDREVRRGKRYRCPHRWYDNER